ncbi:MAG: LLM class flavin-dependent oxidoreductase [Acidimicrobiales bacterium]
MRWHTCPDGNGGDRDRAGAAHGRAAHLSPSNRLRLGILDQSPVPSGSTGADALHDTVALAAAAEALGYSRYWLAEHHNTTGLAGTAPEVLAARVASATSTIRVGAGGVMLSHYSSLKVAEAFRVLHALFPGRIDLGVGRTPGADEVATTALQAGPEAFGDDQFPQRVTDLVSYLEGGLAEGHPHAGARAMPQSPGGPEVWLLGSSSYSAGLAAALGLSFCFAHFITPAYGPLVLDRYRRGFTPAAGGAGPRAAVAVSAICAATDAEAEHLATSQAVWRLGGEDDRGPVPPPAEAASTLRTLDNVTRARVAQGRERVVIGGPDRVRDEITALAGAFGVDEALVVTVVHDPAARLRSYELLAEAFGLEQGEATR